MATVAHPPLDVEEFDALMAASGWRAPFERLAGEVVVTPPIGGAASATTLGLTFALQSWQARQDDPGLLLADVPLILGDERPAPEVSWWREARRPAVGGGAVASVPDLVVEILSPRTRDNDLGIKRVIYERAGVREYWRVDPTDELVVVGRRAEGGLVDAPPLHDELLLASPLLPGFELAVGKLFAER